MSSRIINSSHFSPDIQEFIKLLYKHNVHYVIAGGEAVIYYGYARLTGDVKYDERHCFLQSINLGA